MLRHLLVLFSRNLDHFLHDLGLFVSDIRDDGVERFYLILELLAFPVVFLVDRLYVLLVLSVV